MDRLCQGSIGDPGIVGLFQKPWKHCEYIKGKTERGSFSSSLCVERHTGNSEKRVVDHSLLVCSPGMEPYLSFYFSHAKLYYLIRFRFGISHLLVSYVRNVYSDAKLDLYPCDSESVQCTLHFIFFCKLYVNERHAFLKPLLKFLNIRKCRAALYYLQLLNDKFICQMVYKYISTAVRLRNIVGK